MLCLNGLTGIPAIICGIITLNNIRKSDGALTGRGQAIAGIVTGCIGSIVITAILLSALSSARESARRSQCVSNEKEIGVAILQYAADHDDRLPPTLDALSNYVESTKVFFCSSAKDRTHYSYELTGVTNLWMNNPDVIILRENPANHDGAGGNVLYNDGHVAWIPAVCGSSSH